MNTKRGWLVWSVLLVLLAAGATPALADKKPAPDLKKAIIGKWQPSARGAGMHIEFMPQGKMQVTVNNKAVEGTYKWKDAATIELALTIGKESNTDTMKVEISDDGSDMKMTDTKERIESFKRMK